MIITIAGMKPFDPKTQMVSIRPDSIIGVAMDGQAIAFGRVVDAWYVQHGITFEVKPLEDRQVEKARRIKELEAELERLKSSPRGEE